jgi:hypothetical protein
MYHAHHSRPSRSCRFLLRHLPLCSLRRRHDSVCERLYYGLGVTAFAPKQAWSIPRGWMSRVLDDPSRVSHKPELIQEQQKRT